MTINGWVWGGGDDSLLWQVVGVILLTGQVHVDEDGALLDLLHHRVLHEVVERCVCGPGAATGQPAATTTGCRYSRRQK